MTEETLKQCKTCLNNLTINSFPKKRDSCKTCVTNSMKCIHGRRKTRCISCGGNEICEHDIIKYGCKECGGSEICIHGKRKTKCKECGGGSICEHNKFRSRCIECGGGELCSHRIRKSECVECEGSCICEHKKVRRRCIECGGSEICSHKIRRDNCLECNPNIACRDCKSVYVQKKTHSYPLCQACFCVKYPDHEKSTLYKIKERYLRDELREVFKGYSIDMIFDREVDGGCSSRRPDVLIDCLTHSIIIECDEGQHKNYKCENKRSMQLFEDLGNRPIVMIRFNPDSYLDKNNERIKGCFIPLTDIQDMYKKRFYNIDTKEWKRRIEILKNTIYVYLKIDTFPNKEFTELKLFYDGD